MQAYSLAAHWMQKHTKAFLDLKTALTLELVLRGPKWDGMPFIVTTNGCQEGFAGILAQRFTSTAPSGKAITKRH
ncbi:hypothetical protein DENSPDRAFT_754495, partial [Dentipellis sp. KUC8613]